MKTCFISAPVSVDLSDLKSALQAEGIRPVLPFELPIHGADFREQIEKAIKKAQLFIGVVSSKADNLNVLFELGYASAQHKRVAVIQDAAFELPPNVSGFPVLKGKIGDQEQVRGFLRQLLLSPKSKAPKSDRIKSTKPLSDRARKLIGHVKALGQRATHKELESVLLEAFRDSGIRVIAESKQREGNYDLALWLDEIEYPIGNPILVELKNDLKLSTARALRTNFLAQRELSVGKALLVVYLGSPATVSLSSLNHALPLVLFLSATELLSALENESLAEFIRSTRNKVAHGV
jgi:hypothetical protein